MYSERKLFKIEKLENCVKSTCDRVFGSARLTYILVARITFYEMLSSHPQQSQINNVNIEKSTLKNSVILTGNRFFGIKYSKSTDRNQTFNSRWDLPTRTYPD